MTADINSIISRAYATVLDQAQWQALLPDMAQSFGSDLACVMLQHTGSGSGGGLYNFGIDDADVALYGSHFGPRSELFAEHATSPVGTIYTDYSTADYNAYLKSEIYNDFWRPLDFRHALAGVMGRRGQQIQLLNLRRSAKRGQYVQAEQRRLQQLMPHLVHALKLSAFVDRDTTLQSALQSAATVLELPLLILNMKGKVIHSNEAAVAILARNDGLYIRHKQLQATHNESDAALKKNIGRMLALINGEAHEPGQVVVQREGNKQAYIVLMQPMDAVHSGSDRSRSYVRLYLVDPDRQARIIRRFALGKGFTPSETGVFEALCHGQSSAEIAATTGVSAHTVRFHLKNILEKSHCDRQAALLSEVFRSSWIGF